MRSEITKFILNRGLANVKRYHISPLTHHESVAEHSFYVALIARSLCDIAEESGEKINVLEVLEKALVHDMEEMYSGDILTPVKHANPEMARMIEQIGEKSFELVLKELPKKQAEHFRFIWLDYHKRLKIEDKIVKIADTLSLIAYCLEQINLGNKFMIQILNNGIDGLRNYNFAWLDLIISDIEDEKEKLKIN